MNAAVEAFLLVYAGLFPIVNPVGSAPLFLALTPHWDLTPRRRLALRIALNSFFLLLGSLFVGSHVLEFFGITLPIVRIAGGLVVTAFGWKLLNATDAVDAEKAGAGEEAANADVDSFYPFTMPLTVGPGSISVAITLGSQRPKVPRGFEDLLLVAGGAVAGVLAISATVYVCYRYANRIVAALGVSGTRVLVRLSAFILFCIGIQIIWNGYDALVNGGG